MLEKFHLQIPKLQDCTQKTEENMKKKLKKWLKIPGTIIKHLIFLLSSLY
jgi:hypothetical protein